MTVELTLQHGDVLTSLGPGPGVLVMVDGALAAVFVRLDLEFYGSEQGFWNLEAGFGACDKLSREPFETLRDAVEWVARQVGAPASSVADALQRHSSGDGDGRRDRNGRHG